MQPVEFGKYEVLCRLATGGAARIHLARQPGAAGFSKLVCIKTLLPQRVDDSDFVAMFLDEARLAARLSHPNCVQIFDLGRVNGIYFISMEYIFGETLWNLLTTVSKSRVPLPPEDVAWIVSCACEGLHHAHELEDPDGRPYNLVHRDVSPQNIMLSFEGQTKLLDFGVAKAETGRAATTAGIVKGKFSYMSPEQITGADVDRRSDVFSLGIVLFECLASRRLYRADSPEAVASLILDREPPRLEDVVPGLDPRLGAICARALSKDAAQRYQTARAMGEELRDYLDSIRYTQGAGRIASLLERRFGSVLPERKRAIDEALHRTSDKLAEALGAEPVAAEDFAGEEEDELPDFSEQTHNDVWAGEGVALPPPPAPRAAPIPPPVVAPLDEALDSEVETGVSVDRDDVAVIRIMETFDGEESDLDEGPTTMMPAEPSEVATFDLPLPRQSSATAVDPHWPPSREDGALGRGAWPRETSGTDRHLARTPRLARFGADAAAESDEAWEVDPDRTELGPPSSNRAAPDRGSTERAGLDRLPLRVPWAWVVLGLAAGLMAGFVLGQLAG
ncbi:MAG TPA: serine/threonine-protein kinase [Myxococcales bacterium LLY-WYZ-16_1]|nr:serine/threonine-protein kinase [Myxococcales bacterium LLY-WYZ-16_1]